MARLWIGVIMLAIGVVCDGGKLSVVLGNMGEVNVLVNGVQWLSSNNTMIRIAGTLSSQDGSLQLRSQKSSSGTDQLGKYNKTSWTWVAEEQQICDGNPILITSARVYIDISAVVFEQNFPCALEMESEKKWLGTDWPSFYDIKSGLNYWTINGHFAQDVGNDFGNSIKNCKVDEQGGVPIVLYDNDLNTLVTSQMTRFKTGELFCTGHLAYGVKGTVTAIPAKFSLEFVMSLGSGMSNSMVSWGDLLLKNSGKVRSTPYQTDTVSGIGFWTDNGGYYHYGGDGGHAGGYQEAMQKVHDHHKEIEMPFQHWQLDSWWYPKGDGGNKSSQNGQGDYHWVADPYVFPNGGVPAVQDYVKLPFVLHNRWFSSGNWYKKQGIAGKWTNSSKCNLPYDLNTFWEYFFTQQKGYGIVVYEQDFMFTQYSGITDLQTNATMADDWLRVMAENAAAHGLHMQYCMPYPREYLASTLYPNVITIRASGDYGAGNNNWEIMEQSLLAYAVGLLPFKDTFLSSNNKEPGGASRAKGPEPTPDLQTLVSLLSGSFVGPGDGINFLNKTRVMQTCRSDGLLLKADRVAIPPDMMWLQTDSAGQKNPGGQFVFTEVKIGSSIHYFLLAAKQHYDYKLSPSHLGIGKELQYVAYNWYNHSILPFTTEHSLFLNKEGTNIAVNPKAIKYNYIVFAPIGKGGWAFIGEPAKFVTVSSKRVTSYDQDSKTLTAHIIGVSGEVVTMCSYKQKMICITHTVDSKGTATFVFES